MAAPYRRAGRIQKSHGTQGEVVVLVGDGLFSADLVGIDVWVVPPPGRIRPYRVLDVRPGPKGPILMLEGVDTAAAAHGLIGRWLLVAQDALPESEPQASDVLGYSVTDSRRGYLGTVTDIIVTGANDVFVVDEGPFGQVLLPVIDQVVREVDDDTRSIAVELMEGLLDEEVGS